MRDQDHGAERHVREDQHHVGPRRHRQAPEDPPVDSLEIRRVLLLQKGLDRRQQGGDGHAGEHDRHRGPLSTHGRTDQVRERDRTHGSGEGRQRQELRDASTPPRSPAVAPSPAPAATPRRYGSASGLRNTPWNAAPPPASMAPTRPPRTTRGSRICHRMSASTRLTPEWKCTNGTCEATTRRTAGNDTSAGPIDTPSKTAPTRAPNATITARRAETGRRVESVPSRPAIVGTADEWPRGQGGAHGARPSASTWPSPPSATAPRCAAPNARRCRR